MRHFALGWLALCAATTGLLALFARSAEAPPEPHSTTLALVLALLCMALRQFATSRVLDERRRDRLATLALLAAAALGLQGLGSALLLEAPRAGFLYSVAGAIFALRPGGSQRAGPPGSASMDEPC